MPVPPPTIPLPAQPPVSLQTSPALIAYGASPSSLPSVSFLQTVPPLLPPFHFVPPRSPLLALLPTTTSLLVALAHVQHSHLVAHHLSQLSSHTLPATIQ